MWLRPGLRLRAEDLLGDVLDHAVGHLVGDLGHPRRQHPAGVVGHSPVVLARPADELFGLGLALHDALDPHRLVERPARLDQLVAQIRDELFTVECHGDPHLDGSAQDCGWCCDDAGGPPLRRN